MMWCKAQARLLFFTVHAGSFRVFIIHRTPTWTTGSLPCIRDHSCACVYTQGLCTPTMSRHNIFHWKIHMFSCAPDGIRTSVLWISSPTLSHHMTIDMYAIPSRSKSNPSSEAKYITTFFLTCCSPLSYSLDFNLFDFKDFSSGITQVNLPDIWLPAWPHASLHNLLYQNLPTRYKHWDAIPYAHP